MNKSDIKIIFVDIDWTLLDHSNGKHVFDKKSIKALSKAQKNGVLVYIATARPYDSLEKTGFLNLFKPDGFILSNGSVAFVGNTLVRNDIFNKDRVKNILEVCDKHDIVVELCSEKERWFNKPANQWVEEYFKVFHETIPEIRGYKDENISALLLFAPKELDSTLRLELGRDLDAYRFTDYGIDLRVHPIYKTQGINSVLNYIHISKDNALAIGDSNSDACMFEWCKYSACVGNGGELAKFKANYISKEIKKHGVKDSLKFFKVI